LQKLVSILLGTLFVVGVSSATVADHKGGGNDNGNGYGIGDNGKNNDAPGLVISGANGRVDNGWGNGGENLQGNTPNANGEDGAGDNDDDHGAANQNRQPK